MLFTADITFDEKDHLKVCMAYLNEPLLDGLCASILEEFLGLKITADSPTELGGSLMHARNKYKNRATPLEYRLAAEVGYGAALSGISRKEANAIVNNLLEKYEEDIPDAPLGKTFQEMYDVERAVPTADAQKQYYEAVEELKNIGVPFPY